jgi:CheY-specific phosphatase CheX
MEAKNIDGLEPEPGDPSMVVGSVGFAGKASGVVFIGVPESLAIDAASAMVGLSASELDHDMVNDVIAELSNMIVGFVKSQLCDSGHTCVLTVPSVMRGDHMKVQKVSLSQNRSTLMACNNHVVSFEIVLKSEI